MNIDKISLIIGFLILSSIFSLRISKKYSLPSLLLFLGVGMLAGSEGIGGIYFDNMVIAQLIGGIALAFILFNGAFATKIDVFKEGAFEGLLLAFIGVFINTLIVGIAVYFFTSFSVLYSLLIGAIVSSTDASAVMSLLSFGGLKLKKKVSSVLLVESGTNDPMANVIIVLLISLIINPHFTTFEGITFLFLQIAVGGLIGFLFAKGTIKFLKIFSIKLPEIHQLIMIAGVFLTFGLTNILKGNGYLAIYIYGLFLGNSEIPFKKISRRFFGSLSWGVEIGIFVILGLLVFPSQLFHSWKVGTFIGLTLMLFARPLSVIITLCRSKLSIKEKLFISWGGLKGGVPIVFAILPVLANIKGAEIIFPIIFYVVVISVAIQGTTLSFAASILGIKDTESLKWVEPDLEQIEFMEEKMIKLKVKNKSSFHNKSVMDMHFKKGVLLLLIERDNHRIFPQANTKILESDSLIIFGEDQIKLDQLIEEWNSVEDQLII